ncbi:Ribonucleotide reductase alpha domain [Phytophthora infestans]|uniref:Ribonucleotide reductase alpha domain n=1 Tax=Phytophthora infestans TaxID=4787 RepID=A0A833WDJ4_PHYIN|nr:Ribonucleotide reductase alpha domain [Phytophthora infestans]KAF4143629.1 Ribonucleotide reductase alpha domain [Phytophthora infestans]
MAPTTSNSTSSATGKVVAGTPKAANAKPSIKLETTATPIDTNFEFRTGPDYKPFTLDSAFVASFENQTPPFGFNGLGELVYMRTYSRVKADGTKERWFETIERVINGTFNMQKKWLQQLGRPWDEEEMNQIA